MVSYKETVYSKPHNFTVNLYLRNHSAARFARFRISILKAFNSCVRCSNAAIYLGIATLKKCALTTLTIWL